MTNKIMGVFLFGIGMITLVIGLMGILPNNWLTELGKNNRDVVNSKIFLVNLFTFICGLYTAIKGLQKI